MYGFSSSMAQFQGPKRMPSSTRSLQTPPPFRACIQIQPFSPNTPQEKPGKSSESIRSSTSRLLLSSKIHHPVHQNPYTTWRPPAQAKHLINRTRPISSVPTCAYFISPLTPIFTFDLITITRMTITHTPCVKKLPLPIRSLSGSVRTHTCLLDVIRLDHVRLRGLSFMYLASCRLYYRRPPAARLFILSYHHCCAPRYGVYRWKSQIR